MMCPHMMARVFSYCTTGYDLVRGERVFQPGDQILLTCPMGCHPIYIRVVSDKEDEE